MSTHRIVPALRRAARSPGGRAIRRPLTNASAGGRRGLTLIELMVAMLILNVALLALAGLGAAVSKQMRSGSVQTRAALLVQSRLDSLASIQPCQNLLTTGTPVGTATSGGVTEKWAITDGNDVIHIVDSVTFAGLAKPLVYRSLVPCRD